MTQKTRQKVKIKNTNASEFLANTIYLNMIIEVK